MEEFKVNFLVVGAQKSGTTALDYYLRSHAELDMAFKKEVHFFNNDSFFYKEVDYEIYHKNFSHNLDKIKGECTPAYMYWSDSIRRIYEYNPNMKVIAILRNPIERAFSHWNMEYDRHNDTMDFSTAIRRESSRCKEVLPFQHMVFSYIDRGFYSEQIRRIWRFFPKNQTLFIKHEVLKNSPHYALKKVTSFLNISEFNHINKKNIHSRVYKKKLLNDDYNYLRDIYYYDIKQVEKMLNWNCIEWYSS